MARKITPTPATNTTNTGASPPFCGLGNTLKKVISAEGASLTKAEGSGKVYVADAAKKVSIIELAGELIVVNGNDILASSQPLTTN